MNGRQIPGFYYDEERKKYFKIQPNHAASVESKYSKENVARELDKSRKRKRLEIFKEKKLEQTVRRSPMLGSMHTRITLAREHGMLSRSDRLQLRASVLASQMQRHTMYDTLACEACGKRDIVYDFAFEDPSGTAIVWALGQGGRGRLQYVTESKHKTIYTFNLAAFTSEITSVNINSSKTLVATTLTNEHPGNIYLAASTDRSGADRFHIPASAPIFMSIGDPETTLWTSSPNPPGAQDLFAIGHSKGAYMLTPDGHFLSGYNTSADVRALDWLTPTVCIGGSMRRPVFLWDTRAWGARVRFQHTDPVISVHSLGNPHQILVGGLDSMAIYDVRMTRPTTLSSSHRQSSRNRTPHHKQNLSLRPGPNDPPSDAILRVKTHTRNPQSAIAIDTNLDTIAQRDDSNVVQLYSLTTGKHLRSLGQPDDSRDRSWIRRLRFRESRDFSTTGLVACQGPEVYGWSNRGGDDSDVDDVGSDSDSDEDESEGVAL